jgi:hypothetical protein
MLSLNTISQGNPALTQKQGDLGHTDLQEDNLEFHNSSTPSHSPYHLVNPKAL